eukprot:jgi/Botrbrau1/8952/Bobra.0148s0065.1
MQWQICFMPTSSRWTRWCYRQRSMPQILYLGMPLLTPPPSRVSPRDSQSAGVGPPGARGYYTMPESRKDPFFMQEEAGQSVPRVGPAGESSNTSRCGSGTTPVEEGQSVPQVGPSCASSQLFILMTCNRPVQA